MIAVLLSLFVTGTAHATGGLDMLPGCENSAEVPALKQLNALLKGAKTGYETSVTNARAQQEKCKTPASRYSRPDDRRAAECTQLVGVNNGFTNNVRMPLLNAKENVARYAEAIGQLGDTQCKGVLEKALDSVARDYQPFKEALAECKCGESPKLPPYMGRNER